MTLPEALSGLSIEDKRKLLAARLAQRREEARLFPVSFAQERMWLLNQLDPGSPLYNMATARRFKGQVDIDALERALKEIVARHESLRTTFTVRDGKPLQRVDHDSNVELPVIDLRGHHDPEQEAANISREEAKRPFDLATGPLLRTTLVQIAPNDHLFLVAMHHIVSDGWSMGVFLRELFLVYEAFRQKQDSPLVPLPIQYTDYAVWQRAQFAEAELEGQLSYWKQQLAGLTPLDLPADRPRPAVQSFRGERVSRELPADLNNQLEELSRRKGVTMFMLLLTTFAVLLNKYTRQSEIAIGSGTANRSRPELEGLIGFFVNMFVLRIDTADNPSFVELLEHTRQVVLDALARQDLPFDYLVRELQPERDSNYNPLCRVCLVHQNFTKERITNTGFTGDRAKVGTGTAKFDLTLFVRDMRRGRTLNLEYNADLFDKETVERLLDHFVNLLTAGVAAPNLPIGELSLLDQAERKTILFDWNQTDRDFGPEQCIHELISEQAARTPAGIAAVFNDETITYADLNRQATQFAHCLRNQGLRPGQVCGLSLQRSLLLPIAIIGIWKAGGVYLPIDPMHPDDRKRFLLEDSAATHLVAEPGQEVDGFRGRLVHVPIGPTDEQAPTEGLEELSSPGALAYIIYTSGSTGRPKGVAIEHGSAFNLAAFQREFFQLKSNDCVLQFSAVSYDASIWELLMTLTSGAKLCLASPPALIPGDDMIALLQRQHVTVATLPPSILRRLPPDRLPDLRIVVSAGENCPLEVAQRWSKQRRFVNAYGPTETTVCATAGDRQPGRSWISMGKPIDNFSVYVLDEHMQPVPIGVPGELFVGGKGLAREYINRPTLTAERFVSHVLGEEEVQLYRTGDLVRWLPDGNLSFVGRVDYQLKIRGQRIEPEEIEAVTCQHDSVSQCAVVTRKRLDDEQLVAFVVPDADLAKADGDVDRLRADHVQQWRMLYDENYRQSATQTDPTFNITGWDSIYSQKPIPAEQMQDWVDQAVHQIMRFKPRRVLEIGCGSGLLLYRIAPHCEAYYGTDLSAEAVNSVKEQAGRQGLDHVSLNSCAAHEIEQLAAEPFDMIVLNSVVQYFPDTDYLLDVLRQAAALLTRDGIMFLGDIRNAALQQALYTSVVLQQAPATLKLPDVHNRISRRLNAEKELVLAPDFFADLPRRLPEIRHVEAHVKKCQFTNELSAFRYDVVLAAQAEQQGNDETVALDWEDEGFSIDKLGGYLAANQPEQICLANVPNARLLRENHWLALLEDPQAFVNAGAIAQSPLPQTGGADPVALVALANSRGYDAHFSLLRNRPGGRYDLVLRRQGRWEPSAAWALPQSSPLEANSTLPANNPMHSKLHRALGSRLRDYLRSRLPDYMVPADIILLDELPRTGFDKIDRSALTQQAESATEPEQAYVAPRDETEQRLAQIWSQTLGVHRVGIHDSFFALGGHSLLAAQVAAQVREEFEISLPLTELFAAPTIAELAIAVANASPAEETRTPDRLEKLQDLLGVRPDPRVKAGSPLVPLKTDGSKSPFFCVHGLLGHVLGLGRLAQTLDIQRPFYGLRAKGLGDRQEPFDTLQEMAEYYLAAIKEVQPTGPYLLGGLSMGGLVALEMAQQLRAAGETTDLLVLMDTGIGDNAARKETPGEEQVARWMAGRLNLSWEALGNLSTHEKFEQILKQAQATGIAPDRVEVEDFEQIGKLWRAHNLAFRSYVPQPYPDPVLFFQAENKDAPGRKERDHASAWRTMCPRFELQVIPGNHQTMMKEPNVTVFGNSLASYLDASDADR